MERGHNEKFTAQCTSCAHLCICMHVALHVVHWHIPHVQNVGLQIQIPLPHYEKFNCSAQQVFMKSGHVIDCVAAQLVLYNADTLISVFGGNVLACVSFRACQACFRCHVRRFSIETAILFTIVRRVPPLGYIFVINGSTLFVHT